MKAIVREHAYGLSNQTFLQWAGDFATSFAVTLIAGLIVLPHPLRRDPRRARNLVAVGRGTGDPVPDGDRAGDLPRRHRALVQPLFRPCPTAR